MFGNMLSPSTSVQQTQRQETKTVYNEDATGLSGSISQRLFLLQAKDLVDSSKVGM